MLNVHLIRFDQYLSILIYRGSGAVGFHEVNFIGNYQAGLPSGVVWTKMIGGSAAQKEVGDHETDFSILQVAGWLGVSTILASTLAHRLPSFTQITLPHSLGNSEMER